MAEFAQVSKEPLGILAGAGSLPVHVARAARAAGRQVHIVGIRGMAGDDIEGFSHSWAGIAQVGHMLGALERSGCRELVIIGAATRPNLSNLSIDLGTITNLPALLSLMIGGDDKLLGRVVRFFEAKGLKVVGAHQIAPDLLAGSGALGRYTPSKQDEDDIATGLAVIKSLGPHDVGQAVVVARGHVLGVEAAEGTDAMVDRCGGLKRWSLGRGKPRVGVLVKGAKPGQERRVDLPSIGPETVRRAAEARLSGIAVTAGEVLIAERDEVIRLANRHRLFVVAVESSAPTHKGDTRTGGI